MTENKANFLEAKYVVPFILITSCFALWGFANDVTNPMGSLLGMFVAKNFIQARLDPRDTMDRTRLSLEEFEVVKAHDLDVLSSPYIVIGIVILVMLFVIAMVRMPRNAYKKHSINFLPTLKRIFSIPRYR